MGGLISGLMLAYPGLTFAAINDMTYPQIECLIFKGKPPRAGERKFASSAEARAYRLQRKGNHGG